MFDCLFEGHPPFTVLSSSCSNTIAQSVIKQTKQLSIPLAGKEMRMKRRVGRKGVVTFTFTGNPGEYEKKLAATISQIM